VTIHCLPLVLALGASVLPMLALAQVSAAPPASAAASAPPAPLVLPRPGVRLLTPAEQRQTAESAAATADLNQRPPGAATPLLKIPLGQRPAPARPPVVAAPQGALNPATSGIDDAAAKCEAQTDAKVRAACRERLAQEAKTR